MSVPLLYARRAARLAVTDPVEALKVEFHVRIWHWMVKRAR